MSHKLIALIVKAQNKTEAEQKAEYTLDNVICYHGDGTDPGFVNVNDFGVVLRSKRDLDRGEFADTKRWVCDCDEHRQETEFIRTARVDSESGQKFIKSSLGLLSEQETEKIKKENKDVIELIDGEIQLQATGYYVRDEEGAYIDQNDIRLQSKDYFVVPVDVHS